MHNIQLHYTIVKHTTNSELFFLAERIFLAEVGNVTRMEANKFVLNAQRNVSVSNCHKNNSSYMEGEVTGC